VRSEQTRKTHNPSSSYTLLQKTSDPCCSFEPCSSFDLGLGTAILTTLTALYPSEALHASLCQC
jgi:hypothetical protein